MIYNDFNAIPIYLFNGGKSCWNDDISSLKNVSQGKTTTRFSEKKADCNYQFGIDPTWYLSKSKEIAYLNSFKMKMAVIIGVGHMLLGTCHRMLNFIYRKDWLSFFAEGLPQLCMMCALFGFMDLLIISKWSIDWETSG
jgi:V-type H+-transporting ATPase subunit a